MLKNSTQSNDRNALTKTILALVLSTSFCWSFADSGVNASGNSAFNGVSTTSQMANVDNSNSSKTNNLPSVGSKQGSNQLFGHPQSTGIKGKDYYKSRHNAATQQNSSTNGGSKAGSAQVFGEPAIQGTKGQKYYTAHQLRNPVNKPTQGSNLGSNQIFGHPGSDASAASDK